MSPAASLASIAESQTARAQQPIDEAMQSHESNNLTDLESIFNTINETKKYITERLKL